MFLKSLEAQGFKSFPDKTLLKFEKGITGVVGPNGSGKSNISDAIRWVLGEQSNKQLRGEKSEDVVFNGTSARKPQGMAQVTLCLDNTDRALNCDSDEVFITRRYFRSGESEYQINHATVRLKDVNELFMDTGLGRDGYSMIGQGKISDIVGRRSDERRDMFEEAAGISRFRYRKQEAERRLNSAEDNLIRLRDIMGELEERVGPLAEQSKKAKKFIEYSGEEKNLEIGLWLGSLDNHKEKLKDQEYKIDLITAQYNEVNSRIEEIINQLNDMSEEARRMTVSMDNERRTASEMDETALRLDGQIAVCENNIFHNEESIRRIEEQLSEESQGDALIDQKIADQNMAIEEKLKVIAVLKDELEKSSLQLEELLSRTSDFSDKEQQLNRDILENARKISELELMSVSADSSIQEISSRAENIADAIEAKREEVESLTAEKEELLKDLTRCDEKVNECENSVKGMMLLIKSAEDKAENLKAEYEKFNLEHQEFINRAKLMRDLENSLDGFPNAVKNVMKESERGMLKGICGPVSRLMTVEKEYSIAIEVALAGGAINVVTETEEDAKRAISYLKRENGGRVTFSPVNTVKPREFNEKGLDDCLGFIGIADKLVKVDKKYRNILSSLLGKIVVADTLDNAVAIAKKYSYKFKIVTLDGQVVNTGGSLTGGSFNRATGVLSRKDEIDRLEQRAQNALENAKDANERYNKAKSDLATRNAEIEALKSEVATANEDKIMVLAELKRVDSRLAYEQKDYDDYLAEQNNSTARIEELNQTVIKCQNSVEELKKISSQLEEQLIEISGGKDGLSTERESLTEKNASVRMEILGLEKEIEAFNATIKDLEIQKSGPAGRLSQLEAERQLLQMNVDKERNNIEELKKSAEDMRTRAEEKRKSVESGIARRNQIEELTSTLTNEERELSSKRETLSGEKVRLDERRDGMTKEYDDIISKLFDKYELTKSEAEALDIKIDDVPAANKRLHELKGKIRALGNVNVAAIEEYAEVSERYEFMKTQLDDVETAKKELENLIYELTSNMQTAFIEKFKEINGYFTTTFVELFGGGDAELLLSEPLDVLNSGIEIKVQPPGKKISSIEQLSGGEKSLVALAIYFAMMKVSPPPFCMLDEVETALDDVNVDRFASYMRKMCDNTQFIVVTHRRGTMEEADILYCVTMQEKGVSKLLKLNVSEVEKQKLL